MSLSKVVGEIFQANSEKVKEHIIEEILKDLIGLVVFLIDKGESKEEIQKSIIANFREK